MNGATGCEGTSTGIRGEKNEFGDRPLEDESPCHRCAVCLLEPGSVGPLSLKDGSTTATRYGSCIGRGQPLPALAVAASRGGLKAAVMLDSIPAAELVEYE